MEGFSADPQAIWLTEPGTDIHMQLLEDFSYEDPDGRKWLAPKGLITDGASIPKPLWSSIGSPYTGDYRRASLVHDAACRANSGVLRKDADRMFYRGCLFGGCSSHAAKLLYLGVRIGAWGKEHFEAQDAIEAKGMVGSPKLPSEHTPDELLLRARYTVIAKELEQTPDDFDAIEKVVSSHLGERE